MGSEMCIRDSSICADYFFPRDRPGAESITALAMCDVASQFRAAHVVDSKGASARHAVKQVLRDLRKMGHYGDMKVRMDQESSLSLTSSGRLPKNEGQRGRS